MSEFVFTQFLSTGPPARRSMITKSLESVPELNARIMELTLKEAFITFRSELATQRRKSVLIRLKHRIRALAANAVESYLDQIIEGAK